MKNLMNVDGWVSPRNNDTGKYVDDDGNGLCGFYRRDKKSSGESEMLVLNNGKIARKYIYPKMDIPFSHPAINWRNLVFCGGYNVINEQSQAFDKDDLFNAVLTGKKPIGFIVDTKEKVELYAKMADEKGLKYRIKPNATKDYFQNEYDEVGIANQGTLAENFDIEALIISYRVMSEKFSSGFKLLDEDDENKLRVLAKKSLSDFLSDYDYANPKSNLDVVVTGLILGFAIESTFSFTLGN